MLSKLFTFLISKYTLEVSALGLGGLAVSYMNAFTDVLRLATVGLTLLLLIAKAYRDYKKSKNN